ncbi:hypothetical protein PSI23_18960 [Xenorhabdus sp. XENO-10]|uniref:Uncharacterized protein n=1 Tax=Xenorhabdus yunnanensis TaxID=3025878 RepID=A0ABT5LJL3_9GAMM|nr:hypothetical protein [Xenorhabdus yunnanensis]MDC9591311.1 hypothetical protein [Xenorhabdus yunnanensis]
MNHIEQIKNKKSGVIAEISLTSFGTEILLAGAVPHSLSGNKAGREIDAGGSERGCLYPCGLSEKQ